VSVQVKDELIEDVLSKLFSNSNVDYKILDKHIILYKALPEIILGKPGFVDYTIAVQQQKVTGLVSDGTTGEAIVGANVIIQGTTMGTITDIDGKFSLTITQKDAILVISFLGYNSETIMVGNQTNIIVNLVPEVKTLGEVVVVGYGIQKKESVVGAIAQVKGSDLVKAGVPSVANSLTGRIPGMVTIQQSGMPGANDSKIYIRGVSSFNGTNQPLVLVDGIERNMNDIDPSDVESISVLKDASATSVYGVKGGNGVILITTKRGQMGKMSITATYEHTLKAPTSKGVQERSYSSLLAMDKMYRSLNQYNDVRGDDQLEHFRTGDMPYIYPDVDAWEYMVKDFTNDYRASISATGGTANTKYFISMGYLHEGDVLKSHTDLYDPSYKYDRFNFRMNFDFDLTKSTRLSVSGSGFVGNRSYGGRADQGDQGAIINVIYTTPPWVSPYVYPKEVVAQYPDPNNPVIEDRIAGNTYVQNSQTAAFRHSQKGTTQQLTDRLGADVVLNQHLDLITKGLSFKGTFSYNNDSYWQGGGYTYNATQYYLTLVGSGYKWLPELTAPTTPPHQTPLTRSGNPFYNFVYGGQFNYARGFGRHNITGLSLVERRVSQRGSDFQHFEEKWSSRATYDYDGKYLLEATIGISGSEQFAPSNRFGYFPAIAVGWNIAREQFIQALVPQMNNFKVRYSYGESGSDEANGNWIYLQDYTNFTSFSTGIAGSQTSGIRTLKEGRIPNKNAQWSRAQKHNLGIDLGFFNNELTVTAELYEEKYSNILMNPTIPSWFGQTVQYQNIGSTKRHGYELEVGFNKTINKLRYWIKGNYNFNENRVINQADPVNKPDYLKQAGKPIGVSRQPINIGYYTNMDEMYNYSLRNSNLKMVGSDMLLDFSGDATSLFDAVPIGHTSRPNVTFGISGGLEYNQFDFNFLLQGASMVDRNFGGAANPLWSNNPDKMYIKFKGRDDVWTPDNTAAEYAAWGGWNPGHKGTFNASYLRLKSIEVGYTFTGRVLNTLGLSAARISLNGANLLTYAPGFKGMIGDPENEVNNENGNDYNFQAYPVPKRFTAAIKINF
jgi:TonB-linked SusC/RagA family outer membrane protein